VGGWASSGDRQKEEHIQVGSGSLKTINTSLSLSLSFNLIMTITQIHFMKRASMWLRSGWRVYL